MNSLALLRTAILGVCTGLCGLANAADTNAVTATYVRAFTRLKTDGCDRSTLDALSQALSPVQDREVRAVGCTIYALGAASLGNYQGYLTTYKALASAYPASPYLKQLGGSSVSDSCKTCDGTGQAEQTCAGCNGKRAFAGFGGKMRNCPRCRGSGTMVAKCTTCQGRQQVFSPERAGETLKAFLETAETTLANTYGPLGNYLPEQKKAPPAAREAARGARHSTSSPRTTATAPSRRSSEEDEITRRFRLGNEQIEKFKQTECPALSAAGVKARLVSEAASKQDGQPTLQDAVEFITRKLPNTFHINDPNDGEVTINAVAIYGPTIPFTFFLGSIDPTIIEYRKNIDIDKYVVILHCREDKQHIVRGQSGEDLPGLSAELSTIVPGDEEDVAKLGRAFKRLVEIFGGTGESPPTSIEDAVHKIQRKMNKLGGRVTSKGNLKCTVTFDSEAKILRFITSDDAGQFLGESGINVLDLDINKFECVTQQHHIPGAKYERGTTINTYYLGVASVAGKQAITSKEEIGAKPEKGEKSQLEVKHKFDAKVISEAITYICIKSGWTPPKPDKF